MFQLSGFYCRFLLYGAAAVLQTVGVVQRLWSDLAELKDGFGGEGLEFRA